jgi:PAS domain S-box-containing protein
VSSGSVQYGDEAPDAVRASADRLRASLAKIGAWRAAVHPPRPLDGLIAECCDGLHESIMITDARLEEPGPGIVWVNRGFTMMTGYPSEEVIGRSPEIFEGPRTDRATMRRLRQALAAGGTFTGETWNYRKDGTPFLMHWTVTPVLDADGEVRYHAAVQRDVTRQRQSDRELERRTRELETISSYCPDAIVRLDTDGRVVYASDATESVLGLRPGTMRLRTVQELGRSGTAMEELVAAIDAVRFFGHPRTITVASPFGTAGRWIEIRLVPEAESGGEVEHVVWFAREVSDRIEAEKRARASEERERHHVESRLRAREMEFRDLAESAPMDIWITDEHGADVFANERWLAFTGRSRDGAPVGWRHRIAEEDRAAFDRAMERGLAEQRPFDVECRVRRADGAERSLLINGIPRHDGSRFLGVLATCIDITEHKRRDEVRRRAVAELEHASRLTMAGQMAAAMAHEMAQPLSAVATFIEIAMREIESGQDSGQVLESLRDAQRSAIRAGVLSRQTLGFVRRGESSAVPVDLGDCVRKGVSLMRGDASSRRVDLVYGGGLDGAMSLADPVELEQVICNLVRNAVEAIAEHAETVADPADPADGARPAPRGRIEITGRTVDDRIEIDVVDDGPGVPEAMRSGLFEAFRTAKATGIGLGLWICWNILERYNGEILLAESRPGRTVFRVRVPVRSESEAADPDAAADAPDMVMREEGRSTPAGASAGVGAPATEGME